MSDVSAVPSELVRAAIEAAEAAGRDVADVPLPLIAAAAGISRSTLVRRLGGSRAALDRAVRAAGVDPGGRVPVERRAIEAGAQLIEQRGVAATTLDAVARAADCSVPSLYITFGGRDGLLVAIYESYTPLFEIETVLASPGNDLREAVDRIHQVLAAALARRPRVVPALLADALGRPDGAASDLIEKYLPRAMAGVETWLDREVAAGRVRPLPVPVVLGQLVGPLLLQYLMSAASTASTSTASVADGVPADIERLRGQLVDLFVRAVT